MAKPYKIKRHKSIYRRSRGSILLRVLTITAAAAVLFGIGWALYAPVSEWIQQRQNTPQEEELTPGLSNEESLVPGESEQVEPPPAADSSAGQSKQTADTAKMTAYLPVETVTDAQLFAAALDSAKAAGYDSIMFDLKDIGGTVHYPISYNALADERVTSEKTVDLPAITAQIKDAGLIPVASIYTFRDNIYPSADKHAATRYRNSDFLWMDNDPEKGGKPWINPFSQSGQDYIKKIVDDACDAGFEMIVLQGLQFPEGYSLDMIDYGEHDTDNKNEFLRQYLSQMTVYAAEKGVELTALFPASSMLGGNSGMYFGDTASIAGDCIAVDFRLRVFGTGLQTDLVSIPSPSADPYNTVKTAGAAVREKLKDTQVIAVLDGEASGEDVLSSLLQAAADNQIERCIIVSPTL